MSKNNVFILVTFCLPTKTYQDYTNEMDVCRGVYYTACSASGKYEANPVFQLPTRVGPSCPQGISLLDSAREKKLPRIYRQVS